MTPSPIADGRRRRVCVMTGTRAEYGLLRYVMEEVAAAPDLDLQVVASAMHLVPEFGSTVAAIRADGFSIDAEVSCLVSGDTGVALGQSLGLATLGFTDAFARLGPDVLVLLGDRFEALAAATAATALRIPIAHIHGGERTEGAMDEAFRHAITKMSHLHFTAAPEYRDRVIQMGEAPRTVHCVGAVGLDALVRVGTPDRATLAAEIGFDLDPAFALLTYHPATLGEATLDGLEALLAALGARADLKVLMTKANADPGGRAVNARLDAYAVEDPGRRHLVASLGQRRYLAALREAALVVGNSSSGIIEAPAVDTPVVNLGTRQAGRLRARAVIDCEETRTAIDAALDRALDPAFRESLKADAPPYGRPGRASDGIVEALRTADLPALIVKRFHDLPAREADP